MLKPDNSELLRPCPGFAHRYLAVMSPAVKPYIASHGQLLV
jgi:hypothetical protein